MGRASLVLAMGLLPLFPRSCVDDPSNGTQVLHGSASTLAELTTEVLAGLASADTSRLERLRLTETEHNEMVWPELPASQGNFPLDFAWRNISMRNAAARGELLGELGGHELDFVDVECRGQTRTFASFRVHTDCWVLLRRDGEQLPAQQLFKDVLDWDGELKVFRYYEP